MPKLIDYPRTSYTGAWELAEVVDDTGGKCAIDTAARKLNRKVSGSFKAIIGSAVKFGLMTSKRELLSTTTLFKRIKHAYDKQEELQFHREAFLTPPLFTQLCRKFRNRELPVQMLDVMLIREFVVEEINAQSVAKAFVDGCRMCGLLNDQNIVADIDNLPTNRMPRRELASPPPILQAFQSATANPVAPEAPTRNVPTEGPTNYETNRLEPERAEMELFTQMDGVQTSNNRPEILAPTNQNDDAVASLFGFGPTTAAQPTNQQYAAKPMIVDPMPVTQGQTPATYKPVATPSPATTQNAAVYQMQMTGPGVNTSLDIVDEDDLAIAMALLEKIRRQLRAQ